MASKTSSLLPHIEAQADRVLSWREVNQVHRVRHGIYHRDGRLVSLLTDFGEINSCYPDRRDEGGEFITYTGGGRRGDQPLSPGNRAMLAAIETGHAVPLFRKLAPGRWLHLGLWQVTDARHEYDADEERMLWRFTLQRAGEPPKATYD